MKNLIKESVSNAINKLISESQSFNYSENHIKEKFFQYISGDNKIIIPIDITEAQNNGDENYFYGNDTYDSDYLEFEDGDVVYAFMLSVNYSFDGKVTYSTSTEYAPEDYSNEITDFIINNIMVRYFVEPNFDDNDFEGVDGSFSLNENEIEILLKNNIKYTY